MLWRCTTIWIFSGGRPNSHTASISVPYPDVVVENVHLGDSLMSLGYRLRNQD